jgi:hypothetical protein
MVFRLRQCEINGQPATLAASRLLFIHYSAHANKRVWRVALFIRISLNSMKLLPFDRAQSSYDIGIAVGL